jgi:outer membrane protein assembly factor BamB
MDGNILQEISLKPSIYFLVNLCLFAWGLSAANWLEHRGPTGQGIAEKVGDLPLTWSTTENIAWKTPIEGKAWSTPLIKDGLIYMTNAIEHSESKVDFHVMCFALKDGSLIWDVKVFGTLNALQKHDKNSHASASPIIEDNRLYAHFGYQGMVCLDLEGKTIWKNRDYYYEPTHGNGGSPAIVEDMIVFTCDGETQAAVMALDKMTGKIKWKTHRQTEQSKKFSFGTPILIEVEGEKQIITQASGGLFAYDLQGKEIWKFLYDGFSVVPKPMYAHGYLYFSSGYGRAKLYVIKPTGRGDLTETNLVYRHDSEVPNNPSLLMLGDELYLHSDKGTISCLDAKTGTVHYSKRRLTKTASASPVFADNKIYFTDEKGKTVVLKPGKELEVLSVNEIEEPVLASMAVTTGKILLRTESSLYCIE